MQIGTVQAKKSKLVTSHEDKTPIKTTKKETPKIKKIEFINFEITSD